MRRISAVTMLCVTNEVFARGSHGYCGRHCHPLGFFANILVIAAVYALWRGYVAFRNWRMQHPPDKKSY